MKRKEFTEIENLDIFFNGLFSEDCLVEKTTETIGIIFEESFNDVVLGSDIYGTSILASIKNVDLNDNEIEKEDTLIIRDVKFIVKSIKYDGSGVSELEVGKYEY